MQYSHGSSHHTLYKIYTSILLTFITLLLAAILAVLVYGGLQLKNETNALHAAANTFNKQITSMNDSLQKISTSSPTVTVPSASAF